MQNCEVPDSTINILGWMGTKPQVPGTAGAAWVVPVGVLGNGVSMEWGAVVTDLRGLPAGPFSTCHMHQVTCHVDRRETMHGPCGHITAGKPFEIHTLGQEVAR